MESFATPDGTGAYRARFSAFPAEHFRSLDGLIVSSLGLGMYLGDETDAVDANYRTAIIDAAQRGCNLFDTAINYRAQRSERVLGQALGALCRESGFARTDLVICTKGGYLPFDSTIPQDPAEFIRNTYVQTGILRAEEIVDGGHAMAPRYLHDQIGRSLRNLGLATIDLYYLHNPETQLGVLSRHDFSARLRDAFAQLEEEVSAGRIRRYGVATWHGLRKPPEAREHLSLTELVRAAEAVAGTTHHFRAVQLPYNLGMPEAYASATQVLDGSRVPVLTAAKQLGIAVVASASILQGQLARPLSGVLANAFPGLGTPAQRALQFARSTPGITVALVGMGRREHVVENLALAQSLPAPDGVDSLFTRR